MSFFLFGPSNFRSYIVEPRIFTQIKKVNYFSSVCCKFVKSAVRYQKGMKTTNESVKPIFLSLSQLRKISENEILSVKK